MGPAYTWKVGIMTGWQILGTVVAVLVAMAALGYLFVLYVIDFGWMVAVKAYSVMLAGGGLLYVAVLFATGELP
jgi:hypothetical protein